MTDPGAGPLPAGGLADWLVGMAAALAGDADADVPCAGCTACCASSQFVPVGPDEVATLARIPEALRFPAPGLPPGTVVLPYDEQGRCPMLTGTGCSIYEDRPRTCRTYDCRVFAATGVTLDDPAKAAIAQRAARWRFDVATDADRAARDGLRAAARRLAAPAPEPRPRNATERAVASVVQYLGDAGPGPPQPSR